MKKNLVLVLIIIMLVSSCNIFKHYHHHSVDNLVFFSQPLLNYESISYKALINANYLGNSYKFISSWKLTDTSILAKFYLPIGILISTYYMDKDTCYYILGGKKYNFSSVSFSSPNIASLFSSFLFVKGLLDARFVPLPFDSSIQSYSFFTHDSTFTFSKIIFNRAQIPFFSHNLIFSKNRLIQEIDFTDEINNISLNVYYKKYFKFDTVFYPKHITFVSDSNYFDFYIKNIKFR